MTEELTQDNLVDSAASLPNESEQAEELDEELIEGGEQLDESEDEPESDLEEFEFNQAQYKAPKAVAEAVKSMQKDYTQKTMALADQRRAFEAEVQTHQVLQNEVAQVVALNQQLAEFNQVDWNSLTDSDPQLWQKLFAQRSQIEAKRNELAQQVAIKEKELALNKQQEIAKRLEESESVLKREIKEWSPELETNLQQFAVSKLGFDINDVKQSKIDPRLYKLLHLAYLGDQVFKKQISKPKLAQAKPVTTLSKQGAKVAKSPADMSMADYAKWRSRGYK